MSQSERRQAYERERRQPYHQGNLSGKGKTKGEAAQILNVLSNVKDLPIQPQDDPIMGQLVADLTSTANLTSEEVRSNEWIREYILILYLCRLPTEDGCHGSARGWAHGDEEQARDPLGTDRRLELETFVTTSKLALSRSEDAKVIEEGTRDVSESIVNEPEGSTDGGGLMSRLGLK